jgi:hypothetical protein
MRSRIQPLIRCQQFWRVLIEPIPLTVTIAHPDNPDKLTVVQVLQTARSARTMVLDPTTHRIYLASADFEAPSAQPAPGQRPMRPKMIPNSFRVLVYGLEAK